MDSPTERRSFSEIGSAREIFTRGGLISSCKCIPQFREKTRTLLELGIYAQCINTKRDLTSYVVKAHTTGGAENVCRCATV